ncbi:seven-hairpin glycosidase [Phellopilus nigrolimitatus]|nr:seven-hairpin glycosidase [Phellopilus nigrolimitatus]
MVRAHRLFARHSKSRTSLTTGVLLLLIVTYLLWPSKIGIRDSLDFFSPDDRRPDYKNWPKERRAEAVREAFVHAYSAYETYAMPADELRPLRNSSIQNFNGWGVTMFDGLDTLWLLDLKPEFERAVNHISKAEFHRHPKHDVMFFETVIRYLGGLLSAYALSGRTVLLSKADELAQKLLPVFNTATGMPAFAINPDSGEIDLGPRQQNAVLAEIASCQMEYKYLAHLTKTANYFTLSDKTMDWFERNQLDNNMWYITWNVTTGEVADNHLTIGALADSAYEYLLKQYLMSGRTETRLRDMYITSMNGAIENLLYLSPGRQILYVTDVFVRERPEPERKFEHLSCFFPGLLALGAHTLANEMSADERALHMWAAEGLAYSCWLMYADQASGLAPEEVLFDRTSRGRFRAGGDWAPVTADGEESRTDELWIDALARWRKNGSRGKPPGVPRNGNKGVAQPMPGAPAERKDYFALKTKYLMRPETIESLYVMWRTTGDEIWRKRGWQIFLAIEAACRMPVGYASVTGVDRRMSDVLIHMDEMPSYALAETWKYLYLMFLDHDPLPMDKYVFNTEAHAFPIFEWTAREKAQFGIHVN